MYAVIRTGGKQYKVAVGDQLHVERLEGEVGDSLLLREVLAVRGDQGMQWEASQLAGLSVRAEIVAQARREKQIIFKKRRRQNSRRKNGHRQSETVLKIVDVPASISN